jgi:DNA-binding GntR family transcriptional regulator
MPKVTIEGKSKRAADISEQVFQRLVEAIVLGTELQAGQPLRESALAVDWGVSRTPIREAVRRAAALGLVELRPNQRPLVRKLTQEDVGKLFILRETLELLALDLAWERLDAATLKPLLERAKALQDKTPDADWLREALLYDGDLHLLCIEHCGNPWLKLTMKSLWTFVRILQSVVAELPQHAVTAFGEHQAILQALVDRDRFRARALLKEHLRSAAILLSERVSR